MSDAVLRAQAARCLLRVALDCGALKFGEFTLKSGRLSPYFMNIGMLNTAGAAAILGKLFGATVATLYPDGATLLGLPYKGIPLAALACAHTPSEQAFTYAYLRKETKNHGEGGLLVGAVCTDRPLVLIDDVLTAGTAVRGTLATLRGLALQPTHLLIAFDREESGTHNNLLAREEIEQNFDLPVISLATASDLLEVATPAQADLVHSHLATYGAGT